MTATNEERLREEETHSVWSSISKRMTHLEPSVLSFFLSVVSVACWSMAGNASRISLTAAFGKKNFFTGFKCFGPNALGSFSIGLFQTALPTERDTPWLQRGLCVGFCGAFTTLSSWILDVSNSESFHGAVEELLSGIAFPLIFYVIGADIGKLVGSVASLKNWIKQDSMAGEDTQVRSEPATPQENSRLPSISCVYVAIDIIVLVCVACAAVTVPLTLFLVQHYHRPAGGMVGSMSSDDLRDVMFAPCGAVPRFLLSYLLNRQPNWFFFPVGTLLCNVVAGLLATLLYRGMNTEDPSWRYGTLLTGLCGALSTVSSVVGEVVGFYRSKQVGMSYGYGIVTIAVALLISGVGRQDNF